MKTSNANSSVIKGTFPVKKSYAFANLHIDEPPEYFFERKEECIKIIQELRNKNSKIN